MTESKGRFHNPFGALQSLRDRLPASPGPPPPEGVSPVRPAKETHTRAVVRIERSGRRGKEATVIEHLDLAPGDRETWLAALKAALGCGGSVEGSSLMLQGDQRGRLPALLRARGVKRVTVS